MTPVEVLQLLCGAFTAGTCLGVAVLAITEIRN